MVSKMGYNLSCLSFIVHHIKQGKSFKNVGCTSAGFKGIIFKEKLNLCKKNTQCEIELGILNCNKMGKRRSFSHKKILKFDFALILCNENSKKISLEDADGMGTS